MGHDSLLSNLKGDRDDLIVVHGTGVVVSGEGVRGGICPVRTCRVWTTSDLSLYVYTFDLSWAFIAGVLLARQETLTPPE